jgi:cell division protein FtsW (lipid II flippase)
MYNEEMTKQKSSRGLSTIFLVLGIVFLTIGIATDQTAFTWVAITFVLISLVSGGRWRKWRK